MGEQITFTLNTRRVSIAVGAHENAVDVLRRFDLFGARESCGQGLCGACTIIVDGRPLSGCLTLGVKLDGCDVGTAEGLDEGGVLDPVQQAFIDEGAFQCGFCTPGFVLMARQLLTEVPDPSEAEIRAYLSGNLCRCAAYPEIVRAVQKAAQAIADDRQETNVA